MQIVTTCPICKSQSTIAVDLTGYACWKGGDFTQEALPELSVDQREQLMTGICPTCWDKTFGEEAEPTTPGRCSCCNAEQAPLPAYDKSYGPSGRTPTCVDCLDRNS